VVSVRAAIMEAIARRDLAMLEEVVAGDRRSLRHLVGLIYQPEPEVQRLAARGVALAASHHPVQVEEVIRRLIWAMNDESCTNAAGAPEVLRALAEECPRLLVPMIPDLLRLSADPGLHDDLVETVRRVAEQLPREAAAAVDGGLRRCQEEGGRLHGRRV
jgi:hypothetical protein